MTEIRFSKPSKPACLAYSLPAESCKTGGKLRECADSVCSKCYACKGFYVMPNTKAAMQARLDEITATQVNPGRWAEFVGRFVTGLLAQYGRTMRQIERTGKPGKVDGRYFRWHDSGDLQSTRHFAMICEVARKTPEVAHKIPTKEIRFVEDYLSAGGEIPSNLAVLFSTYWIDQRPTNRARKMADQHKQIAIANCHTTDEPEPGYFKCPATEPGSDHSCVGCRRCWEPGLDVSYRQH